MSGIRVEPAVLEREAAAQLHRALELANAANALRTLQGTTGPAVTAELDSALARFVDVWSWTVDRMVDTTDWIGHAVHTSAYRYTAMDRATAGALDALFLTPDYGRGR